MPTLLNPSVALRRLFIEKPVLTSFELQKRLAEPTFECVRSHLSNAYEAAPIACIADDKNYHCCGDCGNLLLRTVSGSLICEEQRCRRKQANGMSSVERIIPAREEPVWLKRGLRRFVATPGRAELRLEMKLKKLGLAVELWPAFDSYDLRVFFSDGEVWAVDVNDLVVSVFKLFCAVGYTHAGTGANRLRAWRLFWRTRAFS